MRRPAFSGSNISAVKAHNLRAVLMAFLHNSQVSRAELARRASLSNTTITNLVSQLIDQGVVVEEGIEAVDDGRRGVGRPRTVLRLAPEARFAVGVHIGIGTLRVAVTNLYAEIVANVLADFPQQAAADQVLEQIADLAGQCIREAGLPRARLVGLGVGASGLVDPEHGVNVLAPSLGWRDVPIRERLSTGLNLPVCVDNNVRAMALGESLFGAGRGVNSLAFVYGRVGVGAGLVVNGEIFRGSRAGAGEIGHTIMLPEGGEVCRCGRRGCLETLVSERVLVREAERLAGQHPHSRLAQSLRQPDGATPIERVFAAARDGDTAARDLIETSARYLGIALANLVNVLNPELILLGGMFAQGQDLILPIAEATLRATAFGGLGERVRVQPTSFGWRAGVTGAAALALQTFFYQPAEAA